MDTRIFGMPLKRELDIGHLLTGVTLLAGFLWWLFTTTGEMRRVSRREAESGSLRMLLWILRQNSGRPISLEQIRNDYNSVDNRERRKAYCKRDFLLNSREELERAVYQLDWEGKIDFIGGDSIAFRVDRQPEDLQQDEERRLRPRFRATIEDRDRVLAILEDLLRDSEKRTWEAEDVMRSAHRLAPAETEQKLRAALSEANPQVNQKAALIARLAERS